MSFRESYNLFTWKIYHLCHKPSFWIYLAIFIASIIALTIAIAKSDDNAYDAIKQHPTISNCEIFLSKYPNSIYADEIGDILHELYIEREEEEYSAIVENPSVERCRQFLSKYPSSSHLETVLDYKFNLEYEQAIKSNDIEELRTFISTYPDRKTTKNIIKRLENKENEFYRKYINISTDILQITRVQEYLSTFPNGKYVVQANNKINEIQERDAFLSADETGTKYAYEQFLESYPKGKYATRAKNKINEIEERKFYENYSLRNGSQPYSAYYGNNYSYYYGCSQITVNASAYSDVVVIVRYDNSRGNVAGHLYIRKGCSGTINLLDGRYYQVFFYYGSGWYPNKSMPGNIRGGFLNNESYSKDGSPMYLDRGDEITYTLTQVRNGNFSTSGSNANEIF